MSELRKARLACTLLGILLAAIVGGSVLTGQRDAELMGAALIVGLLLTAVLIALRPGTTKAPDENRGPLPERGRTAAHGSTHTSI